MTGIEQIAAELYAGPPRDFVATRNARAKDAGDAELAAQIRALRKPSVAAWVVNLFARERASRLGEALRLAEEVREAQADLDAAALAQLGRERRALTNRLAADAVALAKTRGERITDATLEAVRQTIAVAFFDPSAAAAVASGRLVHDLDPSGDPADHDAAVAGGAPGSPAASPPPADEVAARRELRKAESVLHDAQQSLSRARLDHSKAEQAARDTEQRVKTLAARIAELEAELDATLVSADTAREDVARSEERVAETAERLAAGEEAVDAAQRAVDRRRGRTSS
ncbi:transposase [Microbacterium sp. 22242]|uniref:transposase n=1 Tax=Microbacterium sp. 22242 TaxID=3453896 RepID=UPI003F8766CA